MEDSPWNSLEAAKIGVAILTPLLLLGLGIVVNRAGRRVEDAQWANRKLVEQRIDIYKEMAPRLNDLYCFFMLRGDFRKISPPRALRLKRQIDKTFHVNRFLFGERFAGLYFGFMNLAFETFVDVAAEARIRVDPVLQEKEMGKALWRREWDAFFSLPDERKDRTVIEGAYLAFMECFADELNVRPLEGRAA